MNIQEESARGFTDLLKRMAMMVKRPEFACMDMKLNSRSFGILCILGDTPRPVTMTALAEAAGISSQQLTRLVNELEERGLVRREHNQGNRRLVYVDITENGRGVRAEQEEAIMRCVRQLLGRLSEEEQCRLHSSIQCLTELLEKV